MKGPTTAFAKTGGITSAASGILFLTRGIFEYLAGPPPSTGTDVLQWAARNEILLAIQNEVTFFAALLLIPAMLILYRILRADHQIAAATGCGITASIFPVLVVLVAIQGRLVYPVFGINMNTPSLAEFVVTSYYGGLHAVDVMAAVATLVLGLSMRRDPNGRLIASLSVIMGIMDMVGSFPWIIGPIADLICQTFFSLWFILLAWVLFASGHEARVSGQTQSKD